MVTHIPLEPSLGFGKSKWDHIVTSVNGKIYGIPGRATHVLKITPSERDISVIGPTFNSMPYKWGRGAEIDGVIYCPPASAKTILRINTITDVVDEVPCLVEQKWPLKKDNDFNGMPMKWYAAIKAQGMLFCPPLVADQVLCIEICRGVVHTSLVGPRQMYGRKTGGKYSFGWACGQLAGNGKIYCPPCDATKVLMIDPVRKDVRMVGQDLGRRKMKWWDAVKAVGVDGYIYSPPLVDGRVLRIRAGMDGSCICDRMVSGPDLTERKNLGWGTGVLSYDGNIYFPPRRESQVLKISPSQNRFELVGPKITNLKGPKWCGAAEVDNYVYCVPSDSFSILGFFVKTLDPLRQASGSSRQPLPTDPTLRKLDPDVKLRIAVSKHFREFRQSYNQSHMSRFVQPISEKIRLDRTSGAELKVRDNDKDDINSLKSGSTSRSGRKTSDDGKDSSTVCTATENNSTTESGASDDGCDSVASEAAVERLIDLQDIEQPVAFPTSKADAFRTEVEAARLIRTIWQDYREKLKKKEMELEESRNAIVLANNSEARGLNLESEAPEATRKEALRKKRTAKKELKNLKKKRAQTITQLAKLGSEIAVPVKNNTAKEKESATVLAPSAKGQGKLVSSMPQLFDRFLEKLDSFRKAKVSEDEVEIAKGKAKGKQAGCFSGGLAQLLPKFARQEAVTDSKARIFECESTPVAEKKAMMFYDAQDYMAGHNPEDLNKCTVCMAVGAQNGDYEGACLTQ